jgi:hypothetical protein
METLRQVVARLDELDEELIIYVEGRDNWSMSTPAVALSKMPDGDVPLERDGLRYFLEVDLAREVVEVWIEWRDGRVPTIEEACAAIIHYAENDAYLDDTIAADH